MLRIRPLDTLFTSFDEPFWVDIESDRDTTIDVYVYGVDTPFTSINVEKPYTRAQVWSANPIASNPTNLVHKIIFRDRYTGEQTDVWIAYLSPRTERVELRPARGTVLAGTLTQLVIIGDLAFYRRMQIRRFAPINAPSGARVFHEFYGFNENGEKFYFVERQDRILAALGGNTDMIVTLNPVENVLVTVEYEIPVLAPVVERMVPAIVKDNAVVRAFISAVGGITNFIVRYPVGVARFITKLLGINTDIVGVRVSGTRLRVTYLVDGPVFKLIAIGFGALAGAALGYVLITSIRDVIIETVTAYTISLIFNAIADINRERSSVLRDLINYANNNNLSPDELERLIRPILEMYSTPDITNAIKLAEEVQRLKSRTEELERQLGEESRKKWVYAIGGAGIGALAGLVVRGR